jgi:hypothetical protein
MDNDKPKNGHSVPSPCDFGFVSNWLACLEAMRLHLENEPTSEGGRYTVIEKLLRGLVEEASDIGNYRGTVFYVGEASDEDN